MQSVAFLEWYGLALRVQNSRTGLSAARRGGQRGRVSGLVPSMDAIEDCNDNGMIELFWDGMQIELVNRRMLSWRHDLRLARCARGRCR